jgi:undecaprenyl-diphosphatase
MGDLISALIIAVIQGLTEWIPVSSSGHLVLAERILGYEGGLMFDVALHFGTLMAVFVYFGKDIVNIVEDWLKGRWDSDNSRLGLMLIIATIPAAIVGFLFRRVFEVAFSSLSVVALGFGVSGLFLLIASLDFRKLGNKENGKFSSPQTSGKFGKKNSLWKSFLIGCAQILSLFPGISRSGTTMSSGVMLGLDEKKAIRFSFLMAIPIVFGANIVSIGNQTLPSEMIWATLVSFFVGLIAIHVLFRYVLTSRKKFRWFGAYCLLLAAVVSLFLVL